MEALRRRNRARSEASEGRGDPHFILPWDELFLYDLRLQSIGGSYNAISKDGVSLIVSINFRFQLNHNAAPQLHQAIGPDYVKLLVGPEIGSRLREVIAEYVAEEVYSSRRQHIQGEIRGRTVEKLGEKLVQRQKSPILELYDTLVLGIELPPEVRDAINRKTEQFYIAEEYTYRVIREEKESERKRIEAAGIRDFQQTVSQGISDSYLRWRGIEATLALAQSTNTKIVIIGSGKDGLPIILGNVDGPTPAAAAPRSTPKGPTTAPGSTTPVDKPPLGGLSTPAEKPPAPSGAPTTPAEPPSSSPLSWAGIKALLSWVLPGKGTKTEPGATPSITE